jgi:signal peptide peptidase SppA
MLKKYFIVTLLTNTLMYAMEPNKKEAIGIQIIKKAKDSQSSWSIIKPLIDLFIDDNIKAIILLQEVDYGHFGYAEAFGIAHSISSLKKKYKKPVIAYGKNWMAHSAYVIAAAADVIMVSPLCILGHMGVYMNRLDESDKYAKEGYRLNEIKAGRYKTLFTPYIAVKDGELEICQNIINRRYSDIVNYLIKLRPKLDKYKRAWINGELFLPNQVKDKDNFFIDVIGDTIDLKQLALKLIYDKELSLREALDVDIAYVIKEPIAFGELSALQEDKESIKSKIAVLNVTILNWQNSNHYSQELYRLFKDNSIKGIIASINCKGCNSAAVMAQLFSEIKKLKKIYKKPIVSYIDSLAYSGGYWFAIATDYIIASPLAMVGHIGNRWDRFDKVLKNVIDGKKVHAIASNKFITMFDEDVPLSKEQEEMLQALVENQYNEYVNQVKEARPALNLNDAEVWKESQKFPASHALELGLIDLIGDPLDAIRYIDLYLNLNNVELLFIDFNVEEQP